MTRDDKRAVLYGLIVSGGFIAIDALVGPNAAISGAYPLGAIVAAVLGGFRPALLVAALALPASALSGIWNNDFGDTGYFLRLFQAVCASFLALGAGRIRDENNAQAARQDLLAAVADLPRPGATLSETVTRVLDLLVPRYAGYAAIEGGLSGEQVQLASRGSEEPDHANGIETRLRARGRDIGALWLADGRGGIADVEFLRVLSGRIALALDNAGLSQELVTVEQQLQAILENLGEAVTVQDRTGRLVFANRTAAEVLGWDSVEDLLATPPIEVVKRFTSVNEDGSPITPEQFPGRIVLDGGTPEPLVVRATDNETGEEHWRLTKSTPVHGPDGEVLLAVNMIEDITEAKRAETAQRLLADATAALASSRDYSDSLQQIAELAVPSFADGCSISLSNGDVLERVAIAHRDPAMLTEAWPLDWPSAITAPMRTPDRSVGVLSLVTDSQRPFSQADSELAAELARRAAAAIENARLYAQLEYVATTLQQSLLPPSLPDVPGWKFQSLYMPAGGETDVGGDFYDVFPTAAGWMAVMGDVVGRGPAAASLTAMGRYTLRTAGSLVGTPTMGLARLNDNLRERGDMALCTVAVILLREEGREASLVCAGHPLPFLVRAGVPQPVGRSGPLLGAFEHGHWAPALLDLQSGDVIVLYTDGVLDARGPRDRFGEDRLADALSGTSSAEDAVARVRSALHDFSGDEQEDDIAVLALQKL